MAVLAGDPTKEGLFIVRVKMPNGYKIPAHNHPTAEHITVISGRFNIGMGDKLDEKKGTRLTAGGFAVAPPTDEPLWLGERRNRHRGHRDGAIPDQLRQSG